MFSGARSIDPPCRRWPSDIQDEDLELPSWEVDAEPAPLNETSEPVSPFSAERSGTLELRPPWSLALITQSRRRTPEMSNSFGEARALHYEAQELVRRLEEKFGSAKDSIPLAGLAIEYLMAQLELGLRVERGRFNRVVREFVGAVSETPADVRKDFRAFAVKFLADETQSESSATAGGGSLSGFGAIHLFENPASAHMTMADDPASLDAFRAGIASGDIFVGGAFSSISRPFYRSASSPSVPAAGDWRGWLKQLEMGLDYHGGSLTSYHPIFLQHSIYVEEFVRTVLGELPSSPVFGKYLWRREEWNDPAFMIAEFRKFAAMKSIPIHLLQNYQGRFGDPASTLRMISSALEYAKRLPARSEGVWVVPKETALDVMEIVWFAAERQSSSPGPMTIDLEIVAAAMYAAYRNRNRSLEFMSYYELQESKKEDYRAVVRGAVEYLNGELERLANDGEDIPGLHGHIDLRDSVVEQSSGGARSSPGSAQYYKISGLPPSMSDASLDGTLGAIRTIRSVWDVTGSGARRPFFYSDRASGGGRPEDQAHELRVRQAKRFADELGDSLARVRTVLGESVSFLKLQAERSRALGSAMPDDDSVRRERYILQGALKHYDILSRETETFIDILGIIVVKLLKHQIAAEKKKAEELARTVDHTAAGSGGQEPVRYFDFGREPRSMSDSSSDGTLEAMRNMRSVWDVTGSGVSRPFYRSTPSRNSTVTGLVEETGETSGGAFEEGSEHYAGVSHARSQHITAGRQQVAGARLMAQTRALVTTPVIAPPVALRTTIGRL